MATTLYGLTLVFMPVAFCPEHTGDAGNQSRVPCLGIFIDNFVENTLR